MNEAKIFALATLFCLAAIATAALIFFAIALVLIRKFRLRFATRDILIVATLAAIGIGSLMALVQGGVTLRP